MLARGAPSVVLILALSACDGEQGRRGAGSPAVSAAATPREVKVAKAAEEPWERTIRAVGSLAPFERATLSAKVPGRLASLPIDLGSRVRAGEIVARVDPTDYELRVRQAEAALAQARARLGLQAEGDDDRVDPEQTALVRAARAELDLARATFERWRGLKGTGAASESGVETAESARRSAESRLQDAREEIENRRAQLLQRRADLAVARQALGDTAILAPFDGLALERRAGLGEFLTAGAPIAEIVRVDPLRLRMEIPEREASRVAPGQVVRLTLQGEARARSGSVARLRPAIEERGRSLVVEADVPNRGWDGADEGNGRGADAVPLLRPGAFAEDEVVVDPEARALAIPARALASFAGVDKVFCLAEGKVVERRVTVGRKDRARVEILAGIEPGAVVVLDPEGLRAGDVVRVLE